MNATMTERFNVSGRRSSSCSAGPTTRRRASRTGPGRCATSASSVGHVHPHLHDRPHPGRRRRAPAVIYLARRQAGHLRLDQHRHARRPRRATWCRSTPRSPSLTNARVDLMTAFVSFDRVFEVRSTARRPITDKARRRRPRRRRAWPPSTSTTSAFRLPGRPTEVSVASLEERGRWSPDDAGAATTSSTTSDLPHRAGPDASPSSGTRGRRTRPPSASLIPRLYDVDRGRGAARRHRRARPHPGHARRRRGGQPGPAPVPQVGRSNT